MELWFSFTRSQLLGNILFNSLQWVGLHFSPKFWQLEKWPIVNIKIWFLKFGSYAVCDCSCIWVWVKSKRCSKVQAFITNSFVDLVKDLPMTWSFFCGSSPHEEETMSKSNLICPNMEILLFMPKSTFGFYLKNKPLMSISIQYVLRCQAVDLHKPSQIMSCTLVIAENQMGSLWHKNSMSFTHNRKNNKLITT